MSEDIPQREAADLLEKAHLLWEKGGGNSDDLFIENGEETNIMLHLGDIVRVRAKIGNISSVKCKL
jgi:hypothetical protein